MEAYKDRIDRLRSGRDEAVLDTGFEFTEAGRAGTDSDEPKKSKPRSESPCFVDFGGAGALLGGGWFLLAGGAVVDLGVSIGDRSSKRLIFCCLGSGCCGAGEEVCRPSSFC